MAHLAVVEAMDNDFSVVRARGHILSTGINIQLVYRCRMRIEPLNFVSLEIQDVYGTPVCTQSLEKEVRGPVLLFTEKMLRSRSYRY
jgi:hypothetical protein